MTAASLAHLCGCGGATPGAATDAGSLDGGTAADGAMDVATDRVTDVASDTAADEPAVTADVPEAPGPVELGTGADRWEGLPREGGRLTLIHGPQGGWHVFGRVRLRGVAPDVYLTFTLTPEAGGAPVNLANETVRRQERRGLVLVGDVYESAWSELVILADGVRPADVAGRGFRFGVRVERPDPERTRVLVGSDERRVTVVDPGG